MAVDWKTEFPEQLLNHHLQPGKETEVQICSGVTL